MRVQSRRKKEKQTSSVGESFFHPKGGLKTFFPLLSVLFIVFFLFLNVFVEIEIQRMSYSVVKILREYKEVKNDYYLKLADYTRKTSPSYLHKTAKRRFPLKEALPKQIIQIHEEPLTTPQNFSVDSIE